MWLQEMPALWAVPNPAEEVEWKLTLGVLHASVAELPERLHQGIVGRYGLGKQPPRTLKGLGKELGLSGERVRQLQQPALAWLCHPAHSWYLRHLVSQNTAADCRRALAQKAALRRSRRQKP